MTDDSRESSDERKKGCASYPNPFLGGNNPMLSDYLAAS